MLLISFGLAYLPLVTKRSYSLIAISADRYIGIRHACIPACIPPLCNSIRACRYFALKQPRVFTAAFIDDCEQCIIMKVWRNPGPIADYYASGLAISPALGSAWDYGSNHAILLTAMLTISWNVIQFPCLGLRCMTRSGSSVHLPCHNIK